MKSTLLKTENQVKPLTLQVLLLDKQPRLAHFFLLSQIQILYRMFKLSSLKYNQKRLIRELSRQYKQLLLAQWWHLM